MNAQKQVAQAFIEMRASDPEASSALSVAQANMEAGRGLVGMRRVRVFELAGPLPPHAELIELLHRSNQFYNPSKERCVVRAETSDASPCVAGEQWVLVFERGGERRAGAERWWRHETGSRIEVREGVAWALRFAPGVDASASAEDITVTRDRRHGLLCNPNFQEWRPAPETGTVPMPWIATKPISRGPRARKGKAAP
ncbi:MAG: hypothetical protein ABIU54_03645 [Candidatus Eisenbacteria bacterium]